MNKKATGLIILIVILMFVCSAFLYCFAYGVRFDTGNSYGGVDCIRRNPETGNCIEYPSGGRYTCEKDDKGNCSCFIDGEWQCNKNTGTCTRYNERENGSGFEEEMLEGCVLESTSQEEIDSNKSDDDFSIKEFFENMDGQTVIFLLIFGGSFAGLLILILRLKKKKQMKAFGILLSLLIIIYTFLFLHSIILSIRFGSSWKKPILYLYPEEDIDVKINFSNEGILKTTYPKYTGGWEVHVKSDGSITDENGRGYYALYWDEEYNSKEDFSTGFYVKSEDSIKFLEEKLNEIGLTEREANEFIMYWLPIMEENGNNLVHFEFTKDREKVNKINIEPKPDSMLRLGIVIKKVDKKVKIKAQKLEHFDRVGFSVVEWGGTIIN